MSNVVGNPEELERFALNLKQFNTQLRESMSRLQGQFNQLGDTWHDHEHQKFAQEFEQTMHFLQNFVQTADAHIPFLQRKAKKLYDYRSQR